MRWIDTAGSVVQDLQSLTVLRRAIHDRCQTLIQLRNEGIFPQSEKHPVAVASIDRDIRTCRRVDERRSRTTAL